MQLVDSALQDHLSFNHQRYSMEIELSSLNLSSNLKHLILNDCNITNTEFLGQFLMELPDLKFLDLSSNPVLLDIINLMNMVSRCLPKLQTLLMRDGAQHECAEGQSSRI